MSIFDVDNKVTAATMRKFDLNPTEKDGFWWVDYTIHNTKENKKYYGEIISGNLCYPEQENPRMQVCTNNSVTWYDLDDEVIFTTLYNQLNGVSNNGNI